MRDIEDSQTEWAQEKGAIEQEVARDLSNPTYKFITRLNEDMFSGTPYSHDAWAPRIRSTPPPATMLKEFYNKWYAPNNAILVIAGDVDPRRNPGKDQGVVRRYPEPSRCPRVRRSDLEPVKSESFTLDSNLPYVLGFIAYRMPGTDSRTSPRYKFWLTS